MSGILDQSQIIQNTWLTTVSDSSYWHGQSFQAGMTGPMEKVVLYVTKYNLGNPTNPDLIVEIRTTSAGKPTSTVLATQTILWANIPTDAAAAPFDVVFSSPPSIVSGTTYAIVIYPSPMGTSGDKVNIFKPRVSNANPYANGASLTSVDDNTWNIVAPYDHYFQTYMADTTYDVNCDIRCFTEIPVLRDVSTDIRVNQELLSDINADIRTVSFKTVTNNIDCDIRVNQEILKDVNCDIRTIPYHTVFKDIACDIRVNQEIISDINTDIRVSERVISDVNCDIRVNQEILKDISCDIRVKVNPLKTYDVSCDIRIRAIGDVGPTPVGLEGFRVYLDGDEITDVQIDSLQYEWTKNEQPASASFRLPRKSDNFNKTMEEVTQAITNDTPIEIKFNGNLRWYGFIKGINATQSGENVIINCVDRKQKINEYLYTTSYGRKWEDNLIVDGTHETTGSAISGILSTLVSQNLITSYSGVPGGIIPEYAETNGAPAGSFLTELLDLSGNYYWIVTPAGKLEIHPSGAGTIKNLPSQTEDKQIHLYDILDYNINIHDKTNVVTTLNVEIGQDTTEQYNTYVQKLAYWYISSDGLDRYSVKVLNWTNDNIPIGNTFWTPPEMYSWFGSQRMYKGVSYVLPNGHTVYLVQKGWFWAPAILTVNLSKNTYTVTSIGNEGHVANKKITFSQLGIRPNITYYQYINGTMWMTTKQGYDDSAYAQNKAQLQLSRTKDSITDASIDLTFDAFEYYNIKIGDRVNITSTNETNIYNNNNGFPLDVQSIRFNVGDYKVTFDARNENEFVASANFR